jgi:hypothetical protein
VLKLARASGDRPLEGREVAGRAEGVEVASNRADWGKACLVQAEIKVKMIRKVSAATRLVFITYESSI